MLFFYYKESVSLFLPDWFVVRMANNQTYAHRRDLGMDSVLRGKPSEKIAVHLDIQEPSVVAEVEPRASRLVAEGSNIVEVAGRKPLHWELRMFERRNLLKFELKTMVKHRFVERMIEEM